MAAGAVSLKNLTKCEEVRKLEKELIRLIVMDQPKLEFMVVAIKWRNGFKTS